MESDQDTEGSSPITNTFENKPPSHDSTQTRQQSTKSQSSRPRRKLLSRHAVSDSEEGRPCSQGSDSKLGNDVEELGRFPPSLTPQNKSGSRQPRPRQAKRTSSKTQRPMPASSVPPGDEQLVNTVPRRPGKSVRRAAEKRVLPLGETSSSSQASDSDLMTSSSSSMSPAPIRRPPPRTRADLDLSLRRRTQERPKESAVAPTSTVYGSAGDFGQPLPPRTKNPRDIVKDGERGFIVDLKMNLEVEVELKAKLMGDLTLSIL